MNHSEKQAKLMLMTSLVIFSTIGIFITYIPFPSSFIAFARGVIGTLFILIVLAIKRKKLNIQAIKQNLILLCISGACIGFNWILLFESYRYTSVSNATLCYYMAPVFFMLLSPIVLKEKLPPKKLICTFVAIIGMIIISGVLKNGFYGIKGILLGLGAAMLYASALLMNKFLKGIDGYERTLIQIGMAAVAILPYVLLTERISEFDYSALTVTLLIFVGIVHTGLAYTLYFGSIEKIKAQTVAILSYLDPVIALVLAAVILKDNFGLENIIGSVLILGATLISEIPSKKEKQK